MPIPNSFLAEIRDLIKMLGYVGIHHAEILHSQMRQKYIDLVYSGIMSESDQLECLGTIARTLKNEEHFHMASEWFKELCELAERIEPDSDDTASDYYHLATCYQNIQLNEEAMEALERAREIASSSELLDAINSKIEELE